MENKELWRLPDAKANIGNAMRHIKFLQQLNEFDIPCNFPQKEAMGSVLDETLGFLDDSLGTVKAVLEEKDPEAGE